MRPSSILLALLLAWPALAEPKQGSYLDDSRQGPEWQGATFPFVGTLDQRGRVQRWSKPKPAALPDTLYSWFNPEHTPNLLATDYFARTLDRPLFFWRTPVGSFGYGSVSIRAKLRPGTGFQSVSLGVDGGERGKVIGGWTSTRSFGGDTNIFSNQVYVGGLPYAGYHEYMVLDPRVFESVSFGTPEHAVEIEAEARIVEHAKSQRDYDMMWHHSTKTGESFDPEHLKKGIGDFDHVTAVMKDGYERNKRHGIWSIAGLKERVAKAKALTASPEGNIIQYAPGVKHDRAAHFATQARPYWRP